MPSSKEAGLRHSEHYLTVLLDAYHLQMEEGDSPARGIDLFDLEWRNIQIGYSFAQTYRSDNDPEHKLGKYYTDASLHLLDLRSDPYTRIQYLEISLNAAQQQGDQADIGTCLGNLGLAYYDLDDVSRAIDFYDQALTLHRAVGNREGEANVLGNLGLAYQKRDYYNRAIKYYQQALSIYQDIGSRFGESHTLGNLGTALYLQQKDFRILSRGQVNRLEMLKVEQVYERRLTIAREIGDRRGEANTLMNIGLIRYDFDKVRDAIKFHERAGAIFHEIGDLRGEGKAHWNVSLAYEKHADYKRANAHARAALQIYERIRDGNADMVREQIDTWGGTDQVSNVEAQWRANSSTINKKWWQFWK